MWSKFLFWGQTPWYRIWRGSWELTYLCLKSAAEYQLWRISCYPPQQKGHILYCILILFFPLTRGKDTTTEMKREWEPNSWLVNFKCWDLECLGMRPAWISLLTHSLGIYSLRGNVVSSSKCDHHRQAVWVKIPTPPHASYVTLGKALNFLVPQLFHLQK